MLVKHFLRIICLTRFERWYTVKNMKKKYATMNTTLTAEDRKIICKLKRQFEPEHGKLTATGVIRIALRKAVLS